MDSIQTMLRTWCNSTAVMHFAHHRAASRYEIYDLILSGVIGAALTAIVGSAGYAQLADNADPFVQVILAILAGAAAVLTAVNIAVDFRGRAQRHHAAATAFQGLRREIEEDLVRHKTGTAKASYKHLRDTWTLALSAAPRLPARFHNAARKEVTAHEEAMAAREGRDTCLEWLV